MRYPAALALVRERVKPERDANRDKGFREHWWRFGRPRGEMRKAIDGLSRYIAGNAQGKRFLFCWVDHSVCPSNLTNVFAFDDDYAMGVLTSSIHGAWAHSEKSTLEDRPRYTPTSCFETFPWPQPDERGRESIGQLSRELIECRQAICMEEDIGLTDFYNRVDEGAWVEIRDLHRRLDEEVAAAYGWEPGIVSDQLEAKARLAKLHAEIETGTPYRPF